MELKKIGVIKTPYKSRGGAPSQGRFSDEVNEIIIDDEYIEGLEDLDKCTHLIVLYWQGKSDREMLKAVPPHDGREHGVFATRSPNRPNPIGFCVAELLEMMENKIRVKGLDAIDNSILLDIKPYSSRLDCVENARIGWQEKSSFI